MKKKHTYFFMVVFFIGIFCALLFMSVHEKRTEIIWYLTYPEYYGVEMSEIEPYQEVKSERFELFNKRLKNLGIPAKVVFKYLRTAMRQQKKKWKMVHGIGRNY